MEPESRPAQLPPTLDLPRAPVGAREPTVAAPDLKGDAHPRVTPEPQVDRGTTIGGYEVIRLLGRGGMGGVYLARDPRLGRHVAIKMMNDP